MSSVVHLVKDQEERNRILQANFRGARHFADWDRRGKDFHLVEISELKDMEVIVVPCNFDPYMKPCFIYSRYPNEFDWVRTADNLNCVEYYYADVVTDEHNNRAKLDHDTDDLYYALNVPLIEPPRDPKSSPSRRSGVIEYVGGDDGLSKYGLQLCDATPFVFLCMSSE